MAEPDLLPLPPLCIAPSVEPVDYPDVAQALMDYARANVASAIAPLQAEIEALRAEVERLRTDGASAVRWAPGSAYWSEVLVELFGPDARKGIDVLEARWRKEIERAERLAEVLREAQPFIGWTGSYPELHAKIDALLRDQEEGK